MVKGVLSPSGPLPWAQIGVGVGLVVCGSIPAVNPSIVSQDFVRGLSKAMLKCWQGRASSKLGGGFG